MKKAVCCKCGKTIERLKDLWIEPWTLQKPRTSHRTCMLDELPITKNWGNWTFMPVRPFRLFGMKFYLGAGRQFKVVVLGLLLTETGIFWSASKGDFLGMAVSVAAGLSLGYLILRCRQNFIQVEKTYLSMEKRKA